MTRFALITGGSKGLGAHLVRRFWLDGYSLGVVSRNQKDLQSALDDLPTQKNQSATSFQCDFADDTKVATLLNFIKVTMPHLDVLINNAAIQGPIGTFSENDLSKWQQTLNVNLFAPVALCRGLIPLMKKGSSIINLSGGGATASRANFSAYATAKSGLVRFSETIAEELRSSGIRVNCIAPDAMKTAMLYEVLEKGVDIAGESEFSTASRVLDQGGASMDQVADLALFLASDRSSGITGKLISAVWDKWEDWPNHLEELNQTDIYTLRRITGRDRGMTWGDK